MDTTLKEDCGILAILIKSREETFMPDMTHPDFGRLLENIRREDRKPAGKLKIFFGYAAGVGKTRAMADAACRARDSGVDVVAGYMEPHTGPETMALLDGLERLPLLPGGELDLDAALARHPDLILVDGLAHTNAPGCRHIKRYQDVQELLRAGISVYTTVNVQDLESLNDVVASITGITVKERIPDSVFDSADQVEVVDLEPADLLERLRAGEAGCTGRTAERFFTEKNLAALREIALRRTADRMERTPAGADGPRVKAGEHIMICLSGSPSNARVIRTAARMAEAFHGAFTALFVETPDFSGQSEADRRGLQANLRLAEELGARIATMYGDDPAVQIAEYARISGISKIVLGRSPGGKSFLFPSKTLMDRLNELAPDLDIYIIPDQPRQTARKRRLSRRSQERFSLRDTLRMLGILALCTAVGYLLQKLGFTTANIIMIYILGVLGVSMATTGRAYSLLSSALSVLIFNFFFTHPYFSLVSDPSYITTFAIMFIVALLGSSLTTRIKRQAIQSAEKAYRTEILLETSQKLQKAEGTQAILTVTATQLQKLLERDLLLYPVSEDGVLQDALRFPASPGADIAELLTPEERTAAEWVLQNNKHAGATTGTLPDARCLYLAVRGSGQVQAVAGIAVDPARKPDAFEKNLMVAILDECGLALEKERIARVKQKAEEAARQEALRANLLRTISHDLRTPLTSISGNAGILMENSGVLDEEKKQTLYASIYDDAMWLIGLVENLLSITRMENGSMKLNIQPELLDEVFAEALSHLDRSAGRHHISVRLADDLLMADMDARLIVQVVINIVNNAVKYTPDGSNIDLSAERRGQLVEIRVADDGPGIPDEAKGKLFEMFYTADNLRGDGRRGLGLGLALCRSIVTAHGGTITVADNHPHGTVFSFTLHTSEVDIHE